MILRRPESAEAAPAVRCADQTANDGHAPPDRIVDKVLKDAFQSRSADVFVTEDEVVQAPIRESPPAAWSHRGKKSPPYNRWPNPEEAEKASKRTRSTVSSRWR